MNTRYVIDLDDHQGSGLETLIRRSAVTGEIEEEMTGVQDGEGPHLLYNITDTVMNKVTSEKTYDEASDMSHEHRFGFETFFVDSGRMYLYVDGVRTVVQEGDILHLQPGQQHAMVSIEDVKFRGFFHDLDAFAYTERNREFYANMPEAKDDLEFAGKLASRDHIKRERPVYTDVPELSVNAVKNPQRPLRQYSFEGVTLKIIVPRWENWGVCEYVCAELEPGFTAEWTKYPRARELYYVRSGKVKFTIFGKEYTAGKACVVNIPQWAPHSMVALEKSEVYDMGGQTHWFSFLQDYRSMEANAPERFADPEQIRALKEKFQCDIASIGMTKL